MLVALLRMLRDAAAAARDDDDQRAELGRQAGMISGDLDTRAEADAAPVHDMARRVRQAWCADV